MRIVLKYIINNVKERKARTSVMLLSVIFSTTLLFVSLAIADSYASAQRKMAKGIAGTATISVKAKPEVDGKMAWIKDEAVPTSQNIKNKVGIIETTALYHENGYYENFDILAADLTQLNKINKPRLLNGSELSNFTGNQIVLPDRFTSKYGIKEGDSITLQIGENSVEFKVAGIADYDSVFLRKIRGTNALLPKETLEQLLRIKNKYSEIMIEPIADVETNTVKSELSNAMSSGSYYVNSVVNEAQVELDAKQKSMPFFLISFFSLTMSVFIIYSSYKVITMERLPVIGTFRSIGATEKIVANLLMLESLLYGVIGGIIGIPLGLGILKVMLQGLGKSLSQGIEIPIVVSPLNIIISCAVGIVVSIFSAYIPVRRASKLSVKEVVLGTIEEKHQSNKVKLTFGIILFSASIIIPNIASGKMLYLAGGFSLLGLIVGTIVLIPLITSLVSSLLEYVYGRIFGNIGWLTAHNMRKNKNINQNITLLFISISAVIAISVVGNFVNTYVGDVFKGAELSGFCDAQMDGPFIQKIREIDGMEEVSPIYVMNDKISCNGQKINRVEATDNLNTYNRLFALHYDSEKKQSEVEAAFLSTRSILFSNQMMQSHGWKEGHIISLTSGNKTYDYTIIGSYKTRASSSEAVIPSASAVSDFGMNTYGMVAFKAADPDAAMIIIRDLFGNKTNWSRTVKEFNSDTIGTISAFLDPMHKMTYFILLLATIGVINNLLINYMQKRHSIAMYKSVGLSNKQNVKMTLLEGFTSGFIGAMVGIIISYMEIKTIFLVAGPKISISPELNIEVFLMSGLMGVTITLIGSLVPILKGSQMKIVEEIKSE